MEYDVIIIGAGPGGLTAGLYSKWLGLNVLIFDDIENPSQLELATHVENIPGFKRISGIEYIKNLKEQVNELGVEIRQEKVLDIATETDLNVVFTDKEKYNTKCIIFVLNPSEGLTKKQFNMDCKTLKKVRLQFVLI